MAVDVELAYAVYLLCILVAYDGDVEASAVPLVNEAAHVFPLDIKVEATFEELRRSLLAEVLDGLQRFLTCFLRREEMFDLFFHLH